MNKMTITTISPRELLARQQAGQPIELIDVRTPVEFREVHVTFARNVPLDQLDPERMAAERSGAEAPLYVICRSGARGKQACEKLLASGCCHLVNVEGGTQACEQAGLPVARGRKAFSLERQVRIAAGALALLGGVLGIFVHPSWAALAALVGVGLMHAGITDSCLMGLLLARMPWNQVAETGSCAATGNTTD
jgi:rhodanese-related sulfurtransferase